MPLGRPSKYTQEVATQICQGLIEGRSLRSVCEDEGLPTATTVFRWLADNPNFREQYTRAKEAQAEAYAEQLIELSDAPIYLDGPKGSTVDTVDRSKLMVDTRKWIMVKLLPKKYGDRVTQEIEVSQTLAQRLKEARQNAKKAR